MAEAIGLAASLVSLIQLAGQATAMGYTYISGVKRATNDLHDISRELSSLNLVLFALQKYMDANPQSSTLQQLNCDNGPLKECESELKVLLTKMEPKTGFKGFVNSLKWPLKEAETMQHITRIERQKSLLILALETDRMSLTQEIYQYIQKTDLAVQTIRDITEALNSWTDQQDMFQAENYRKDVLGWLFSDDFDKTHLEICNKRQKGTGTWLLEELSFQKWAKGQLDSRILFGYGIPGAGKTYLSSVIIDHLETQTSPGMLGVTFFYFNFKEQHKQEPAQFVASLVKQLAYKLPKLPREINNLYKKLAPKGKRPDLGQLNDLLLAVARNFAQVFIVVDALDECNQEKRKILLPLLHRLGQEGLNLFVTSRPHPEDVRESFRGVKRIEISAKDQDIRLFINQKIQENSRARRLTRQAGLQDKIADDIVDSSNGMFLIVRFHIEFICQQVSAKQLLKALSTLKTSQMKNPLNPTYERIVKLILEQPTSNSQLALLIISWLVKARRVLKFNELQMAISIDPGVYRIDPLDLPDKDVILDVCGGLVAIDESDNIHLVHHTAQEYLVNNHIIPTDADLTTALTCITLLSFDAFSERCKDQNSLNDRIQQYPFLKYAAIYLYHHLRSCDESLTADALFSLIKKRGNISSYLEVLFLPYYHNNSQDIYPVQVAAKLGHCTVQKMLLDNGHDISVVDRLGNTVLHYAITPEGNEKMIAFLLEKNPALSTVPNNSDHPPLSTALILGNDEAARILIEHESYSSEGEIEWSDSVVKLATEGGNCAIMRSLLENGVDPARELNGWMSPFEWVIIKGHEELFQLMLPHIDLAELPVQSASFLEVAITHHHRQFARALIENGHTLSAQVQSKRDSDDCISVFHHAAANGLEDVVKLMVEKGADLTEKTRNGYTALELAISQGHESTATYLEARMKDLRVELPPCLNDKSYTFGEKQVMLEIWYIERGVF